jgi:hypothetical protein
VGVVLAPVAKTVEHWSTCGVECIPHHLVPVERDFRSAESSQVVAVVVFEVVDPPICKAFCIVLFPIKGSS